jgi:antirestriction protein
MSSIYVGTYAKYNAGSLKGEWLDPEDYASKDEFLAACAELHKDEADPELMFQDHEGIPEGMVSESHIDAALWEWLDLDADDAAMWAAYREDVPDATYEQARDAYQGTYESEVAFAEQLFDDMGYLKDDNPLRNYVDWDAVALDLRMDYSFIRYEGTLYVFRQQ